MKQGGLIVPARRLSGNYSTGVRLYHDPDVSAWDEYVQPKHVLLCLDSHVNKHGKRIIKVFHPSVGITWVYAGDMEAA